MPGLPLDYAIRNLARRPLRTILTGFASTLVALTTAGAAAFVHHLEGSFANAGDPHVGILLSRVSEGDVLRSTVSAATGDLVIADVPGVVRIGEVSAVSSEIHMGTNLRLGRAAPAPDPFYLATVRGITNQAFLVHDRVTITAGRPPGPGEVLVGRLAGEKMGTPSSALAIGEVVRFENSQFVISGIFSAPGTTLEAEIWAPLAELRGLTKRDDSSAVFVRLNHPGDFSDLEVFARRRLDLELTALPSLDYYRELADYFEPIRGLAWLMALLIGAAVLATGANTLAATVQDRSSELATLRTLGYSGAALVRSLASESLVLAAGGGLLGLLGARFLVTGSAFRIGMTALEIEVGPVALLLGAASVLALAFLGTFPAALRVLRLPVASSLKESS